MNLKKYKLFTFLGIILLIGVYIFVEAPNLNPFFYSEGAFFWAVVITIFIGVWALFRFGEITIQFSGNGEEARPFNYVPNRKFPKWTKVLLALPWIFFGVMLIASSFIFNWKAYRDQLGTERPVEFSSEMQAVDMSQVPIVDQELANILADKKLGERAGLGSQVVIGANDATIQKINGKLVWAVPLYHSGVFKWLTNLSGTPGYILVSATDVNDVQYIETHKLKYQPNNYLLHDLKRHTRFGGAWFDGITDPSFEVDDEGQPYWVYTTYRNKRFFNLPEATGAWIVNATTGEMNKYSIADIPEWVDRVQPENFILQQINNKGEFVRGWLNFADKDKFRASQGHMIVYNNDRCYLFTGFTSVGGDNSAIGFFMVDMVTKDTLVYQMPGATELAAQGSAEGKVQHLGYRADFPLILNIDGQPTYFMPLKDASRLIKQYAFVSVENYSIVGTGETMELAMRDYRQGLKNAGVGTAVVPADGEEELTGTVLRFASELTEGQTLYKLILSEAPDRIFLLPAVLSDELALTQEGDRVWIEYADVSGQIVTAAAFDNLMFPAGGAPETEKPVSGPVYATAQQACDAFVSAMRAGDAEGMNALWLHPNATDFAAWNGMRMEVVVDGLISSGENDAVYELTLSPVASSEAAFAQIFENEGRVTRFLGVRRTESEGWKADTLAAIG